MSQPTHLRIVMVDERLKVSLQVSPAPLQSTGSPVHLGPVAVDDAPEMVSQQLRQRGSFATGKDRKHSKPRGHRRPQPSFLVALPGWRFVHVQLRFAAQRLLQLFIWLFERCGNLVLHFDRQRWRTGHAEEILQKEGGPAFALAEVSHQEADEGHQSRPRLASRHACGKFRTSRFSAAGAVEPMALVLRHVWLDNRQLPHLVTNGLRITAVQFFAATAAFRRLERNHFLALLSRDQRSLVLRVAGLTATLLLGLLFVSLWFGVRMLTARWQRIISWRLFAAVQRGLQISHDLLIIIDDPLNQILSVRRQSLDLFDSEGRARKGHGKSRIMATDLVHAIPTPRSLVSVRLFSIPPTHFFARSPGFSAQSLNFRWTSKSPYSSTP